MILKAISFLILSVSTIAQFVLYNPMALESQEKHIKNCPLMHIQVQKTPSLSTTEPSLQMRVRG